MNKKMNKLKKVTIIIILILIFVLCCIPNKTNNSKFKLNIKSSYGDCEAYHPKVLSFEKKWNGYKYWMSYTPYPKGDDSKENPHIAVSNDLINWTTPEGGEYSLDDISKDGIKEQYNSDSHLVYNTDTGELECYWRFVDDINDDVIIYRRKSKDGLKWDNKEIAIKSSSRKKKDYISPAIIYENKVYKIWYVDIDNILKYAISIDGTNWKDMHTINLEYEENNLKTWHLDVISTTNGYEMLVVAYDKWDNRNDMNLYYTSSKDGINWVKAEKIISPAIKTNNWDNKGIYRSSFIYENEKYFVFYSGTNRSYNHGIGFVYGKDIKNLKAINTNFNSKKEIDKLKSEIEN